MVAESLEGAIEVAMDSRLNAAGKWFGAGVLKSHFKGVSPAPADVRCPHLSHLHAINRTSVPLPGCGMVSLLTATVLRLFKI